MKIVDFLEDAERLTGIIDAHGDAIREELGVAAVDQVTAATRDTQRIVQEVGAAAGLNHRATGLTMNVELMAIELAMLAAAKRRGSWSCEHAAAPPRDGHRVTFFLTNGLATCDRPACCFEFRSRFEGAAFDDGRCDICDAGTEIFTHAITSFGPACFAANACDECMRFIKAASGMSS